MAWVNRAKIPDNLTLTYYSGIKKAGSWLKILSRSNRRVTIGLTLSLGANVFIMLGMGTLIPLLFSSHYCGVTVHHTANETVVEHCTEMSDTDFTKILIVNTMGVPGTIIGLITAAILGRLLPLRVGWVIITLILAMMMICISETVTLVQKF